MNRVDIRTLDLPTVAAQYGIVVEDTAGQPIEMAAARYGISPRALRERSFGSGGEKANIVLGHYRSYENKVASLFYMVAVLRANIPFHERPYDYARETWRKALETAESWGVFFSRKTLLWCGEQLATRIDADEAEINGAQPDPPIDQHDPNVFLTYQYAARKREMARGAKAGAGVEGWVGEPVKMG